MQDATKDVKLSPQEAYEVDRKSKIAERTRLEIEEERDDARMSSTMDKLGLDTRPDGKRTNKAVIRHNTQKHDIQDPIKACIIRMGLFAESAKSIMDGVTQMTHIFGHSVAHTKTTALSAVLPAQDAINIYDTIAVSAPTSHILNNEIELITLLREEIEVEQNLTHKSRLQMEFDDLVKHYDVIIHPVTGMYVHRYDHILLVEQLNNPHQKLKFEGTVCYYLPKADIASSRGIKRGISDVYNQNPQEVELTHAEATAQVAAQPLAPTPRIS